MNNNTNKSFLMEFRISRSGELFKQFLLKEAT